MNILRIKHISKYEFLKSVLTQNLKCISNSFKISNTIHFIPDTELLNLSH